MHCEKAFSGLRYTYKEVIEGKKKIYYIKEENVKKSPFTLFVQMVKFFLEKLLTKQNSYDIITKLSQKQQQMIR